MEVKSPLGKIFLESTLLLIYTLEMLQTNCAKFQLCSVFRFRDMLTNKGMVT